MKSLLKRLNINEVNFGVSTGREGWIGDSSGSKLASYNPTNSRLIAEVIQATPQSYDQVVARATKAFHSWRSKPAPARGQVVRDLGNALRDVKEPLGDLASLEMGKIRGEGHGEATPSAAS